MLDQAERFGANHPYSPHLDRDWWRQLPIAREAQAALASLLSDRERLTRELEEMRADAERWRAIKNLVRQNAKRAGLGGGVILCSMDANEHDAAWASIQAIDHENPRNTLWMSEAESLDVAVDAARASLLQSEDD